jgi:hypothetical protein
MMVAHVVHNMLGALPARLHRELTQGYTVLNL